MMRTFPAAGRVLTLIGAFALYANTFLYGCEARATLLVGTVIAGIGLALWFQAERDR